MIESQRIIKTIATLFALFLAINIVLGIIFGIAKVSGILKDEETEELSDDFKLLRLVIILLL